MADVTKLASWTWEQLSPLGFTAQPLPEAPQRVVLGFDGSPPSLEAATWAAALAHEVHPVTALDISVAVFMPPEVAPPAAEWIEAFRTQIEELMPELADRLEGCQVKHHVLEAGPARALMQTASDTAADLLVVGHAGKGGLDRLILGSVAEALVHHAEVPVLVARGGFGPGPILAAIGGDDGSEQAAGWATALASRLDRDLLLGHAARGVQEPKIVDRMGSVAKTVAVPWPPKKGLAALAEREQAALLVVGHRPGRRWLGSTAISLIRHAPCSVLVARSKTPGEEAS